MTIHFFGDHQKFLYKQCHLLTQHIFNGDIVGIMLSESSAMSKCLSISQVTDTALDFLLCQHQSFNLGSSLGTADSISQQKIKPGAWASILVMQLILFFFFFSSLWKWLTLLLSLVYCRPRRMYGKFLCIPYGNILPVYYSISSHTFYFLRPSGGELPYTVLRNLKTQLDLDVLCSNTKLIFHLIVIWFLEAIHGLCSYSLLKFGE